MLCERIWPIEYRLDYFEVCICSQKCHKVIVQRKVTWCLTVPQQNARHFAGDISKYIVIFHEIDYYPMLWLRAEQATNDCLNNWWGPLTRFFIGELDRIGFGNGLLYIILVPSYRPNLWQPMASWTYRNTLHWNKNKFKHFLSRCFNIRAGTTGTAFYRHFRSNIFAVISFEFY